jgi:hypothetical protein
MQNLRRRVSLWFAATLVPPVFSILAAVKSNLTNLSFRGTSSMPIR